jgi:hypothetical protein
MRPGFRRPPRLGRRPETGCVAGHGRLELRNVGANYTFETETSCRFLRIYQILAGGDCSRLSCGVEDN